MALPKRPFNCEYFNFQPCGLNRNLILPRLALAFALRRCFWEGVSKARKRRTSSRIPSASSLFFSRFSARSTGSPLRTITSGIDNHLDFEIYSYPASRSLLGPRDLVKSSRQNAERLSN